MSMTTPTIKPGDRFEMTDLTDEREAKIRASLEANGFDDGDVLLIGADDLRSLLDALTSARERAERAEAERDEARQGERGMSEHVLHVATEANDAFAAAEALDEFWDVCGYPSNRGTLTPAEQVASITRERDAAEARVVELEGALEPFANLGVTSGPDDEPCSIPYRITRGSIRKARAALTTEKTDG